MDDEIDRLVVAVRADTSGFARDVAAMRSGLEDGMGQGSARAGTAIESALVKAVKSGQLGFDDLRRTALAVLGDIASSALSSGIGALFGGSGGGGLASLAGKLIGAAVGLPGRATGGPVTGGRGYLVGEQGPELFVPTGAGQVMPLSAGGGGQRDVRVSISVGAPAGAEPQALARSGRQVARAVRDALDAAGR